MTYKGKGRSCSAMGQGVGAVRRIRRVVGGILTGGRFGSLVVSGFSNRGGFAMNWSKKLSVGDRVSYSDVNQWRRKGRLVSFGRGKHGGNCFVRWDDGSRDSEECACNLISWF